MKGEDYWGDLNGDGIIKLRINRVLVYGIHSFGPGWGSTSNILNMVLNLYIPQNRWTFSDTGETIGFP